MPQAFLANQCSEIVAGESPSLTLPIIVKGGANEQEALACLLATVGTEYLLIDGSTLFLQSAAIRENISWEPLPLWKGQAVFGSKEPKNQESPLKLSFTIGSEGVTVKTALAQQKYPVLDLGAVKAAPDHKLAIGATKDGVAGANIDVATFEWEEEHTVLTSVASNIAYLKRLKKCANKVNDASFRDFDAGEVRFRGATGSAELGKKYTSLRFRFAQEDNAVNVDCGNGVVVAKKLGWQHLDVMFEQELDNTAKAQVCITRAAYVNTVYKTADFSLLGIGT